MSACFFMHFINNLLFLGFHSTLTRFSFSSQLISCFWTLRKFCYFLPSLDLHSQFLRSFYLFYNISVRVLIFRHLISCFFTSSYIILLPHFLFFFFLIRSFHVSYFTSLVTLSHVSGLFLNYVTFSFPFSLIHSSHVSDIFSLFLAFLLIFRPHVLFTYFF